MKFLLLSSIVLLLLLLLDNVGGENTATGAGAVAGATTTATVVNIEEIKNRQERNFYDHIWNEMSNFYNNNNNSSSSSSNNSNNNNQNQNQKMVEHTNGKIHQRTRTLIRKTSRRRRGDGGGILNGKGGKKGKDSLAPSPVPMEPAEEECDINVRIIYHTGE